MSNTACVVTGMSAITPLGHDLDTMWQQLQSGANAIRPLNGSVKTRGIKVAAYIDPSQFDTYCPDYKSKKTDRSTTLALNAVNLLIQQDPTLDLRDAGVILGTGFGITELADHLYRDTYEKKLRVPPHTITACMENVTASQVAMTYGCRGYNSTLFTACSAGTNALGLAYRLIKHGYERKMLVIGVDASLTQIMLDAWAALRAGSISDNPSQACLPFSQNRSGLVVGEGVGVMLLESSDSASSRKATVHAKIAGYASNCDAAHITQSDVNSQAAVIKSALSDAGLSNQDIQMISAHGTATVVGDKAEAEAINLVFGANNGIPVNALKSQLGHTIGASGILESIFSIMMMQKSTILPTINYTPDPLCPINVIPKTTHADMGHVLKNSFGFGGNNTSLILALSSAENKKGISKG